MAIRRMIMSIGMSASFRDGEFIRQDVERDVAVNRYAGQKLAE